VSDRSWWLNVGGFGYAQPPTFNHQPSTTNGYGKLIPNSHQRFSMSAIVVFDIDGVIRDVGGSYRLALADTVEQFTDGGYRPTDIEIDELKGEGIWNNDWEASQELIYRYFEQRGQDRSTSNLDYDRIVAYFQTKYRGTDPVNWNGYICNEPLLATPEYFDSLTTANIPWGFFSGATTGSASYVLEKRLGLISPVLVAMEDAPGKPNPEGLFMAVDRLAIASQNIDDKMPLIYVGDTVADMYTIVKAQSIQIDRQMFAVGIIPPHVKSDRVNSYTAKLIEAGANIVLNNVRELTPKSIEFLTGGVKN
jgi:HAD superfamily phosphatase